MYTLSFLVAALATVCVACALPSNKPRPPNKPKNTADLFANQTASSCKVIHNIKNTTKSGLIDPSYRWEAFNVYIDEAYEQADREAIEIAMWTIMQILPCISFGIWDPGTTPTGDYVRTVPEGEYICSSYIGKIDGEQEMVLTSPQCMSQSILLETLFVALGVDHEHLRSDRDEYIEIKFENILPGYEEQFEIPDPEDWDTFEVPYNPRSIMHYGPLAFSSNGEPTIVAKDGGEVGTMGVLQDTDIQTLNIMYNC